MKAKWLLIFQLVLAVNLACIDTVQAEDFIFNIPLRLYNLHPDVDKVQVSCDVFGESNRRIVSTIRNEGAVSKPIYISNYPEGNFKQNIVLKFNADKGKNPNDATHYTCVLYFVSGRDGRSPHLESPLIWAKANPDKPFRVKVTGRLDAP